MKDIDYLDKCFPKGKNKFRGEAMVLLALARHTEKERILKLIEKEPEFFMTISINDGKEKDIIVIDKKELKNVIKGGSE